MRALCFGSPSAMAAPVGAPRGITATPERKKPSRFPVDSNGQRLCSTPQLGRASVSVRNQATQTPKPIRASSVMRNHSSPTPKKLKLSNAWSRGRLPVAGNLQSGLVRSAPLSCVNSALRLTRPSRNRGSTSCYMLQGSSIISTALGKHWQRRIHKGRISCQLGGASSSRDDENSPDANVQSTLGENNTVQFDLDLARRSLLVEFTCNVCQARTQRMINPDAFRRGTVYVQCGGCEKYHQLVDNLNLVEEFDFKAEDDSLSNDLGA